MMEAPKKQKEREAVEHPTLKNLHSAKSRANQ